MFSFVGSFLFTAKVNGDIVLWDIVGGGKHASVPLGLKTVNAKANPNNEFFAIEEIFDGFFF